MRVVLSAALVSTLVATLVACLEPGEPCCAFDAECESGTTCFEGRCAPRCDDTAAQPDAQCDEGERCVPGAGVCRAAEADGELERCPYEDQDASP